MNLLVIISKIRTANINVFFHCDGSVIDAFIESNTEHLLLFLGLSCQILENLLHARWVDGVEYDVLIMLATLHGLEELANAEVSCELLLVYYKLLEEATRLVDLGCLAYLLPQVKHEPFIVALEDQPLKQRRGVHRPS